MRELLTESNMVALNTFFAGDPFTWTKIAGHPARLDCICASTELLATTKWAGVRKDIDVSIGSAEDHWPVFADVCLQIGQSKESESKGSKHEHSVSIDRSLVHDQNRVWDFQSRLEQESQQLYGDQVRERRGQCEPL